MTVLICDVDKEESTCDGGFPGIQSNDICCALACGQCGGSGCSSAGGLTAEECCTKDVAAADVPCTIAGAGPCVLGGELFFHLTLELAHATCVHSVVSNVLPVSRFSHMSVVPGLFPYISCGRFRIDPCRVTPKKLVLFWGTEAPSEGSIYFEGSWVSMDLENDAECVFNEET